MAAKGLLCLSWRFGSLHGHPLGEQGEDLDIVLAILEDTPLRSSEEPSEGIETVLVSLPSGRYPGFAAAGLPAPLLKTSKNQ